MDDGSEYYGQIFDNKIKDGIGKIKYQNGDTYYGEFKNGLIEGFGYYLQKNGYIYKGLFE